MALIQETDYGTPKRISETLVTLEIDGKPVTVPAGTSVMRAAAEAGVQVPKLCATRQRRAIRFLPPLPGRSRRTPRYARLLHDSRGAGHEGADAIAQARKAAARRDGAVHLRSSAGLPDVRSATANCELQDMAGVVGLREVRYGYDGENHLNAEKDESNPYFTVRSVQVHRLLALRARLRRSAGHFRADHRRARLRFHGFGRRQTVHRFGMRFLRRVRAGLPHRDADGKDGTSQKGQPEHSVVTTCAYCGVGCSFKAEMQGNEVVRMVPFKDGKANHGHSCVKGRFAWGYATHKDRILKPMIRAKITDPWHEVSWEEAIGHAASEFKRIQAKYGRDSIGGITSSRCTDEETYPRAEDGPRRFRQQQRGHLRARLPFAHGLRH